MPGTGGSRRKGLSAGYRVPDDIDAFGSPGPVQFDRDEVDPPVGVFPGPCRPCMPCARGDEPGCLFLGERFLGHAECSGPSRLHLHENQVSGVFCNDVDLPFPDPVVALDDLVANTPQVGRCSRLPGAAGA